MITFRPGGGVAPYDTTLGRAMFQVALQGDYADQFGQVSETIKKSAMGVIVERLSDNYNAKEVARSLDAIKNLCYRYASQSGLTVSIDDVKTPAVKREWLDEYEAKAEKVENQFRRGIITDGERRQQEVPLDRGDRTAAGPMEEEFRARRFNPIDMMVGSGAEEHDPDAPDRRHARPGGQPPRRHDPPPDQVELP